MMLMSNLDVGFEIEGMSLESNYSFIKKKAKEFGIVFWTGDSSIVVDQEMWDVGIYEDDEIYEHEEVIPFEINTRCVTITPKNILKVYKFFEDLYYEGLVTNDTCALHLHVKRVDEKLKSQSALYTSAMMLAYLVETKKYESFLTFEHEKMSHSFWSDEKSMLEEYEYLKKTIDNDSKKLSTKRKRGLFHIHETGTLEWRGPRGFLDANPIVFCNHDLKSYHTRLFRFMKFLFSIIPILRNACNGVGIEYSEESVYWKIYQKKIQKGY